MAIACVVAAIGVRYLCPRIPAIGEPIPFWATPATSSIWTGREHLTYHTFEFRGAEFNLGSTNGAIVLISTGDPEFRTPEGISVGSSLAQVLNVSSDELHLDSDGTDYVATLPSGWLAVFWAKQDGTPPDNDAYLSGLMLE